MDWLTSPPALLEIEPQQFVHEAIAEDIQKLKQQAALQGIGLDIASGYRSVERQLAIWNAKWQGDRPLLSRDGGVLNPVQLSDSDKLTAILTWSALPGVSRHHWGTDFDVYDKYAIEKAGLKPELITSEYEDIGPCAPLSAWLAEHAKDLGFNRPYIKDLGGIAREPWHLSHMATAKQFEQQLHIDAVTDFITGIDIQGKSAILQNLDWIYPQFVLNKGKL